MNPQQVSCSHYQLLQMLQEQERQQAQLLESLLQSRELTTSITTTRPQPLPSCRVSPIHHHQEDGDDDDDDDTPLPVDWNNDCWGGSSNNQWTTHPRKTAAAAADFSLKPAVPISPVSWPEPVPSTKTTTSASLPLPVLHQQQEASTSTPAPLTLASVFASDWSTPSDFFKHSAQEEDYGNEQDKREKRARNRDHARQSRQRKKSLEQRLEGCMEALQQENARLTDLCRSSSSCGESKAHWNHVLAAKRSRPGSIRLGKILSNHPKTKVLNESSVAYLAQLRTSLLMKKPSLAGKKNGQLLPGVVSMNYPRQGNLAADKLGEDALMGPFRAVG